MIFNKLEYLSLQIDNAIGMSNKEVGSALQLQLMNDTISEVLDAVSTQQRQFESRLATRRQLQAVLAPEHDMPSEAKQMYVEDQLAFYRQLIGEMLTFFTGSEQGRCVSFSLTVEELLFFIRLLLEEKVMEAGALKPIFLFLSKHARTVGSDALSYESLRKKYSGVQAGAKRRVSELLSSLAKRAAGHMDQD